MPRVFSMTGSNVTMDINNISESGLTELRLTSLVWVKGSFVDWLHYILFFADALRIDERPRNEGTI
jgi:hypothetical protein